MATDYSDRQLHFYLQITAKLIMTVSRYLWLLLCYAQYTKGDTVSYEEVANSYLNPKGTWLLSLPIDLGVERTSGCICRASSMMSLVVCFGGYQCRKFPKVRLLATGLCI